MKKKILKLAKALSKFNKEDILMTAEIDEEQLDSTIQELASEGLIKILSEDSFLYISTPTQINTVKSTKEIENIKPLLVNPQNIPGYKAYLEATGTAKKHATKYFELFQACGNLRGAQLKKFINEKWNTAFPEYASSYSAFMMAKKSFIKQGFYGIMPNYGCYNRETNNIFEDLYSLFKTEYFSSKSLSLTKAVNNAGIKFAELNPDFDICQLPGITAFSKRLKKEYTAEEVSLLRKVAIRNKIKSAEEKEEIYENEDILFRDASSEFLKYQKERVKHSTYITLKGYIKNHLVPALGEFKVIDITQSMIDKLKEYKFEDGFSISSVNSYIDTAEQIIKYFVPKSNKLSKTELHKKNRENFYIDMRILSREEIKKLLEISKTSFPDFYPLILTAITTGMTRGEMLGLTWDCVNFEQKTIWVGKSLYKGVIVKHRANFQVREINVPDDTINALANWKLSSIKSDFVFPNSEGNFQDPDNMIKRRFNPLIEKARIKKIRFLDLRDTYASLLIKQNVPLTYVQQQLGHSSVDVTVKRYEKLITHPEIKGVKLL